MALDSEYDFGVLFFLMLCVLSLILPCAFTTYGSAHDDSSTNYYTLNRCTIVNPTVRIGEYANYEPYPTASLH